MEKKFKLKMVTMPNFLTIEMPPRPRQEGMMDSSIPVSELSEAEANEYAEEMKLAFVQHWKVKVAQTENEPRQKTIR